MFVSLLHIVLPAGSIPSLSTNFQTLHHHYRADARINCQPSRKRQTNAGFRQLGCHIMRPL